MAVPDDLNRLDLATGQEKMQPRQQAGFAVMKLLIPVVFLAIGILVFKYLLDSKPAHQAPLPKEKTWSVRVAELRSGKLSPEVEIQGRVEAPELFRAAAPGAGWVEEVNVREGDTVHQGQLLVALDARDFMTELTQAEADLADIEAQLVEGDIRYTQDQAALVEEKNILRLAEKSVARKSRLKKQSLSSESELEQAQRELLRQQLLVNQRELAVNSYPSRQAQLLARKNRAQAKREQAQRALQRSRVVAPFDGIISAVKVAVGGRVSAGSELVTEYAPAMLEVRALIPSIYQDELARALDNGSEMQAYANDSQAVFRLVRLAGEARPGGVDGFFEAVDPTAQRLTPGELLTLVLQRPAQEGLFLVPPAAIYDNRRLYLLRDGRLVGVEVEIVGVARITGESLRLVRGEGLSESEQLVLTRLPNATTGLKAVAVGSSE